MGQERAWRTPKNYVCVEGYVFRALTVCDPNSFSAGHGIDKIPNIGKNELLLSKSWNKKWGPLYLIVFALKLQKVRTTSIPCDFWVRIGATVKTACMWKLEKKHWKIRFYGIYIEIKQLGIEMKFEYHLKWFSTIHCRRPRWESWTQQHPFCLRFAHFQHFETHLGQKNCYRKFY